MSGPEPPARSGAAGVAGLVVLLVVAVGGLGHFVATRQTRSHAPGSLDGAGLYRQYCERCHRPDLKGSPADQYPSLLERDLPDAELARLLSEGKSRMPSFKGVLDPHDVGALTSWLRAARGGAAATTSR